MADITHRGHRHGEPDNPQNHHVQRPWVGAEVLTLRSQVAAQTDQVAQLRSAPKAAPPGPKSAETLSAITELAKALKLVAA